MALTSSTIREITMRIVNPDTTHEEFLEEASSTRESMNPNELALALNKIAAALDNSKNPSRELVLADIHRILASMEVDAGAHEASMVDLAKKYLPAALLAAIGLVGGQEAGKMSAQEAANYDAKVKASLPALEALGKAAKGTNLTFDLQKKLPEYGIYPEKTIVPPGMKNADDIQKMLDWDPGVDAAVAVLKNGGSVYLDQAKNEVVYELKGNERLRVGLEKVNGELPITGVSEAE